MWCSAVPASLVTLNPIWISVLGDYDGHRLGEAYSARSSYWVTTRYADCSQESLLVHINPSLILDTTLYINVFWILYNIMFSYDYRYMRTFINSEVQIIPFIALRIHQPQITFWPTKVFSDLIAHTPEAAFVADAGANTEFSSHLDSQVYLPFDNNTHRGRSIVSRTSSITERSHYVDPWARFMCILQTCDRGLKSKLTGGHQHHISRGLLHCSSTIVGTFYSHD